MKFISFVIPVFNSSKTINELVSRIDSAVLGLGDNYKYEIILVNDHSKDNSLEMCKEVSKKVTSNIHIIDFSKNFGQHSALMAGFRKATGDYIVCLDDDLQNPPEEVGKLLNAIETSGYDIVFGIYESKKHSLSRNIGTKINDIMAYYLINKPKDLKFSSYFIAKRFIIEEVIKYNGPYPYIHGIMLKVTSNIGNIIIRHDERLFGKSNYRFVKLLSLWLNGFTNFSVKPLRLASLMGFLLSIISFILVLVLIIRKIISPEMQIGWTSTMIVIVFFGGIQLLCIGLLGEYIGRIYLTMNRTPQYVIKEEYKNDI